ncbi:MAG TPA: hypothetical protein VF893_05540 [Candidatus Bathyarchaeia archaeon]
MGTMMKRGIFVALIALAMTVGLIGQSFAQTQTCETCPMEVGADAQEHFVVYDGNGTRHWVECIGCALKLLKTYDTIRIETYCDWYGPEYPVVADISQHGAVATVNPSNTLILLGGGCTANRVAYNQTAADELLANGYSEFTMMMMQQALPTNTNVTTIPARALTFAATTPGEVTEPQSYLLPVLIAIVGIVVIAGAIVAYKKLKR